MPPRKAAGKQKALTTAGFWPMLPKTAVAVGKYASVVGKYWTGCPADDKLKRFMCIVALHAQVQQGRQGHGGADAHR